MKFYCFKNIAPSFFYKHTFFTPFFNGLDQVGSIEDCDICFNPISYEFISDYPESLLEQSGIGCSKSELKDIFFNIVQKAKYANKKIIILYYNDPELNLNIDNAIFFRTSLLKKEQQIHKDSFAFPAWKIELENSDFLNGYLNNNLVLSNWEEKPSIGFRGASANYKKKDKVKSFLEPYFKNTPFKKYLNNSWPYGYQLRALTMSIFTKDSRVNTDFCNTIDKNVSFHDSLKSDSKKQYIQNIKSNPYGLCIRGFGNYSFRFYELLSCGRIPVFVDTDCVLPYDFMVNYKDLFVWIDEKDIKYAADIVIDFHKQHKNNFKELQIEMRKLWENYFSPIGFVNHFESHFILNIQ